MDTEIFNKSLTKWSELFAKEITSSEINKELSIWLFKVSKSLIKYLFSEGRANNNLDIGLICALMNSQHALVNRINRSSCLN